MDERIALTSFCFMIIREESNLKFFFEGLSPFLDLYLNFWVSFSQSAIWSFWATPFCWILIYFIHFLPSYWRRLISNCIFTTFSSYFVNVIIWVLSHNILIFTFIFSRFKKQMHDFWVKETSSLVAFRRRKSCRVKSSWGWPQRWKAS